MKRLTSTPDRQTLTALEGAARGYDPVARKAARFALNTRALADANRSPAAQANKLYGAKK